MRFGSHIWVYKGQAKRVNDIGMLDLLEKSVKHKKTTLGKHFFLIIFAKASLKVVYVFGHFL